MKCQMRHFWGFENCLKKRATRVKPIRCWVVRFKGPKCHSSVVNQVEAAPPSTQNLCLNFSRSFVANSLGGMDNASISRASAPRGGELLFQRPLWMEQSIQLLSLSSPLVIATVANSGLVRMRQRCWRVLHSGGPFPLRFEFSRQKSMSVVS